MAQEILKMSFDEFKEFYINKHLPRSTGLSEFLIVKKELVKIKKKCDVLLFRNSKYKEITRFSELVIKGQARWKEPFSFDYKTIKII